MEFDADLLLAALPVRVIENPPADTPLPRLRGSPIRGIYNGFTPKERGRTSALASWLTRERWMAGPETCDICRTQARQHHAEDYYDLARWVDICVGCHSGLHKRFDQPGPWLRRLDTHQLGAGHWARLVSPTPFDLAALLRARGRSEPTAKSMIAGLTPPPAPSNASARRPRQRFGEMSIPPGSRLVHPMAPDLEVLVVNDNRLLWRGSDHSLTSLTNAVRKEFGLPASRDLWEFEGRSLGAIYDATYGGKA